MNAKYLLLNHFSQRYPKLPRIQPFDPASEQKRPIIALAFDLMSLPLKAFPAMETYNDALEALFIEMEEVEPESDAEEEIQTKPGDKKNGKKIKGKQNKESQNASAEASEGKQPQSIRQRKRQERREGLQTERASVSGTAVKEAASPSSKKPNAGAKRRLSNAGGDGIESTQKGLKRSKSDAEEKLTNGLNNLEAPL